MLNITVPERVVGAALRRMRFDVKISVTVWHFEHLSFAIFKEQLQMAFQ